MFLYNYTDYLELEQIAKARNLEHWVCFECRKMFKRPARPENIASGPLMPAFPYICPQCRGTMHNMGIFFEPPRRTDSAGWARMKLLAEFGHGYYTEGCKAYNDRILVGRPPASPRELLRRLVHDRERFAVLALRRNVSFLKEIKRQKSLIRRLDRLTILI